MITLASFSPHANLLSQISCMRVEDEEEVFAEDVGDVCHVVNGVETQPETPDFPLRLFLFQMERLEEEVGGSGEK